MKDFFEEFEPTNYTEWRKLVEKELKRPIQSYQISEGILANPFLSNSKPSTLSSIQYSGESWKISQQIFGENYSEINRTILSALENGASGLCIVIKDEKFDFETVFQGVFLDFIEIRFCLKISYQKGFIKKLKEYFQNKKKSHTQKRSYSKRSQNVWAQPSASRPALRCRPAFEAVRVALSSLWEAF